MSTLLALAFLFLSGAPAVLPGSPLSTLPPPALNQSADPQTCIELWVKLGQDLVETGYARHGGIEWQNGFPVIVEPAINPAVCPALIAAAKQLYSAGCDIDREAEITRAQSEQSDAQYRACQSRFPDSFDRYCYSYFIYDQQVSGRHTRVLEVRSWIAGCLAR